MEQFDQGKKGCDAHLKVVTPMLSASTSLSAVGEDCLQGGLKIKKWQGTEAGVSGYGSVRWNIHHLQGRCMLGGPGDSRFQRWPHYLFLF